MVARSEARREQAATDSALGPRPSALRDLIVVGLGPGDPGLLTRDAIGWLTGGRPVYLRTRIHPTVDALAAAADFATRVAGWASFDALYEGAADFDTLYSAIVDALLREAESADGPIVYAVPGHPLIGESTVARLRAAAPARGIGVRVVPGLSFVDVAAASLPIDPLQDNLQLVDGLELAAALEAEPFSGGRWPISPLRPALIGQVYNARTASSVKLALMRLYPDEHPVTVLRAAGVAGAEEARAIPLHALDRAEAGAADHLTSVFVPALPPEEATRVAQGLQAITARLRAPDGCPWDREQTHQSIRSNFLEETYEALDALDAGDMDAFREELGDVLLQVYLQSQMAEEAGEFTLEDVYEAIASKLVRRHPHVFGDVVAHDAGTVLRNWDQIKEAERRAKGERIDTPAPSALDGVPRSLPALARAALMLHRIDRLLPARRPAAAFAADLDRALAAVKDGQTDEQTGPALGAALLALAGLAHAREIDPEAALGTALAALAARFKAVEERLRAEGRDWRALTEGEVTVIWDAMESEAAARRR